MATLEELTQEIEKIKQRNQKVEADKKWETSWMRKIMILISTYIVATLLFFYAGSKNPFLDSLVPTFAFVLSTLSIPFFKKFWLKYINKSNS